MIVDHSFSNSRAIRHPLGYNSQIKSYPIKGSLTVREQ